MSDRCIDLWCRVLRAVPGSEIRVFAVPPGQATTALRQRFELHGIGGGRVTLHPRTSIDAYFAAIGDVDIALDTFPYNGGTTTFDVLWMQTPLVALAGDRPAARSGVSILTTLGLPELIATTDDDYVAINVRLAHESARIVRLHASAILDSDFIRRRFIGNLLQGFPDESMRFLRLLRRRGATGPDRPDRLVSDHGFSQFLSVEAGQATAQLA